MAATSLYGGWPLTNSKVWPGEKALTCPKCGSQDVTLTSRGGYPGTGPGGRVRVGDPGQRDVAICQCGEVAECRPNAVPDPRYTVGEEGTGSPEKSWVARFCGEWIGSAENRISALNLAHDHSEKRARHGR